MLFKNVASQGIYIYAHDTVADAAKTGDAANITATISKDGAATVATNDVNPTEIGGGVYFFNLTQAETNADAVAVIASSATANIQIDPIIVLTTAGAIPKVTFATAGGLGTVDASNNVGVGSIAADAITAAAIAPAAIDAATFATDAITAASLATDAGAEIGTAVWATATRAITDKSGFSIAGTITTLDGLNDPTSAAISTAVWGETLRTITGAGLTSGSLATLADLDAHGAGAWTTASTAGLALETSVQTIITTGGTGPWTSLIGAGARNWLSDSTDTQIVTIT